MVEDMFIATFCFLGMPHLFYVVFSVVLFCVGTFAFWDLLDILNFKKIHFCSYLVRKTNIWRPGRAAGVAGAAGWGHHKLLTQKLSYGFRQFQYLSLGHSRQGPHSELVCYMSTSCHFAKNKQSKLTFYTGDIETRISPCHEAWDV